MVAKKAKEVTMYVSSYSEELIRGNNHISYLFFRAIKTDLIPFHFFIQL